MARVPVPRNRPRRIQHGWSLPHSIIKGADVEVGVALDQSVIEPLQALAGPKKVGKLIASG